MNRDLWKRSKSQAPSSQGKYSAVWTDGRLAALAQTKSLEHLRLSDCSLDLAWRYPKIEIKNVTLEEKGKFRIEGAISVNRGS